MDTITIICDSVAMCVRKTAGVCQPCVKECRSCNDVTIVGIICITILLLAIIVVLSYLILKFDKRKADERSAQKKREYEEKDRASKKQADVEGHNQSENDHNKKRKEEQYDHMLKRKEQLEDKLLCYLENRITDGDIIANEDRFVKELINRIDSIKIDNNDKEA